MRGQAIATLLAVLELTAAVGVASAQLHTLTKDQMIRLTEKNPFGRFPDGRPMVPDALLKRVEALTMEEVWGTLPQEGYNSQYEGNFQLLHPGKKLIGRAVTAQFMPARPDLEQVILGDIKATGFTKGANQWVIDKLQPGDVLVVDLFGKIEGGTMVGDNLATAIYSATGRGFVLDGAIRDLEGIFPIDMAAYFRGVHPSAIRGVMLTGLNIPVRIGNATVMPGDVVLGDREGVYFIPPHLVQKMADKADRTQIHDEWTKAKFLTGKYKSSELYPSPIDPKLKEEYEAYLKKRLAELGKR